ncbi:unnamed protein product [Tetraodon nigroviridis]|nr:unnamed protein product [Tetraodon nigroviridis]
MPPWINSRENCLREEDGICISLKLILIPEKEGRRQRLKCVAGSLHHRVYPPPVSLINHRSFLTGSNSITLSLGGGRHTKTVGSGW